MKYVLQINKNVTIDADKWGSSMRGLQFCSSLVVPARLTQTRLVELIQNAVIVSLIGSTVRPEH